jgi:hypothetical protein
MKSRIRIVRNVVIVAVCLFAADGFLYRDPGVSLPHGYEIVAISSGSPCILCYKKSNDDRPHSEWTAWMLEPDVYTLRNSTGRTIEYDSEEEWRAAAIKLRADPTDIAASLSGVTGYKANRDFAIGTFVDGYWLLDFATHRLDTWTSEDDWEHAVSARTSLKTTGLRNPKGWFNQSRDLPVLAAYAAIFGVTVLLALRSWRRAAPHPDG